MDPRSTLKVPFIPATGAVLALALVAPGLASVAVAQSDAPPDSLIPADRGVFTPTGSMTVKREVPTATLFQDGRVLVVGGYGAGVDLASAEIWDPVAGVFSQAGALSQGHDRHTATLLTDGRVLIVGGEGPDVLGPDDLLASAEIWDPGPRGDPSTMSFSPTGSLAEARRSQRATPAGRAGRGRRRH